MRAPDAVIVGAQKAATTGLLHTLARHRAVVTPRAQEAVALHSGPGEWDRWMRRYEPQLDAAPEEVLVVKLATAMNFADTLSTIRRLNPAAKAVAVLRHPVDRMLSLHRYAVQLGLETRPAEEALLDDTVERADRWRLRSYGGGSRYAEAIADLAEVFGRSDVCYVDHADLHDGACLPAVQEFLGIEPRSLPVIRANESRPPRSAVFARATNSGVLRAVGRRTVPARWRETVRATLQRWNATPAPPAPTRISEELRARLIERHLPDVLAAERVLARPLPGWRR